MALLFFAAPVWAKDTAPAPDKELSYSFGAWVELNADGGVVSAALPEDTKLPAAVRAPLMQNVQAMRFEPARVDGVAKPSRSWLNGRLRLVPQGDNYALVVEPMDLGPRPLKPFIARTGPPPAKPQRFLMHFEVSAEGRVQNIEITALDRKSSINRSLSEALKDLRFEPEQVDGQAVATTLRWPFQVRKGTADLLEFDLPPLPRDPQRPGLLGKDAYAEPIIFTMMTRVEISR
jgi:hypothetical protein